MWRCLRLMLVLLALRRASALTWIDAPPFPCPANSPDHCSPQERAGYDWSDLPSGPVHLYGSHIFHGFAGDGDLSGRYIAADLDDGPSMYADSGFSIDRIQLATSREIAVSCEYGMPDGSVCRETHPCTPGGSIFTNTQCGGARNVTFKSIAPPSPSASAAPSVCSIIIYSIDFRCASTPPTSTASSSPPAPPSCYGNTCSLSSTFLIITSVSSPSLLPSCYGSACLTSLSTSSSPTPPQSCYGGACSTRPSTSLSQLPPPSCYGSACSTPLSTSSTAAASSAPPPSCYGSACSTPLSTSSTAAASLAPPPSCYGNACSAPPSTSVSSSFTTSSVKGPPVSSSPPPLYPSGVSAPPECYGSDCSHSPISLSMSASNTCLGSSCSSFSTGARSSTVTCNGALCSGVASRSSFVWASTTLSTLIPPHPSSPGELVACCMNTWLFLSGCRDNADIACNCQSRDFYIKVGECVQAWNQDKTELPGQLLQGICAPYVSANPAIVTAFLTPAIAAPTSSPGITAFPITTIVYSSGVLVTATYTAGVSSGLIIPSSSLTSALVTTLTVPDVHMITTTVTHDGTTSRSAGLSYGPSTSASASQTNSVATIASTSSSTPAGIPLADNAVSLVLQTPTCILAAFAILMALL